jgi:hypothetical protein
MYERNPHTKCMRPSILYGKMKVGGALPSAILPFYTFASQTPRPELLEVEVLQYRCPFHKTVPQPELDFGFKMAKSCGQKLWRAYPVYTSRNTSCGELVKLWRTYPVYTSRNTSCGELVKL